MPMWTVARRVWRRLPWWGRLAVQLLFLALLIAPIIVSEQANGNAGRAAADAHRAAVRAEQIAVCVKNQLTARNAATTGDAQALQIVIGGLDRFEKHVFPHRLSPAQYKAETAALTKATDQAKRLSLRDRQIRDAHPFSGCG